MGLKRCEAIVLKSQKLGELDKIVTFLSREDGKLRGVAKGARKLKQRFGSAFEPLTHLRLQYFEKGNVELVRVESTEIVRSHFPKSGENAGLMSCIAELLDGFAQEGQGSERLFRLALAVADAAEAADSRLALAYFEVWLLRLSGLLPSMTRCVACGRDVGDGEMLHAGADMGGLKCDRCAGRRLSTLGPAERVLIAAILRLPPREVCTSAAVQPGAAGTTHAYLRMVIEHALGRRVRSFDILDLP